MTTSLRSKKISRELLLSVVLTVFQFLPGPLLLPILARTFSKETYAAYSLLLNTNLVLNHVMVMGTSMFVFRSAAQERSPQAADALKSVLILVFVASLAITMVLQISLPLFLSPFDMQTYRVPFRLVVITSMLTAWLFVINFHHYGQQKVNLYSIVLFIRNSGWRYLLLAILILGFPLDLMLVAKLWLINLIVAMGVGLKGFEFRDLRDAKASLRTMSNALRFGVPLIPYYISAWALVIIIQYQLQLFSTAEKVADFSFGISLFNIVISFAVVIPQVLRPYIFESWKRTDEDATDDSVLTSQHPKQSAALYEYSIKYSGIVFILATTALIAFAPEVTLLMGGEKYRGTFPLLIALAAVFFIRTIVTSVEQWLLSTGQSMKLSLDYLVASVTLIIVGSLLILLHESAYSAAISLLLTNILLMVVICQQVFREIAIKWEIIQAKAWLIWAAIFTALLLIALATELTLLVRGTVLFVAYAALVIRYRIFVTSEEITLADQLLQRFPTILRR